MSTKRVHFRLALIAITVLALLGSAYPANATPARMTPSFYTAQYGDLINGWHWLRTTTPAANATWRFTVEPNNLIGAHMNSFYIVMEALVTNTKGGGSGFSRSVLLQVRSGGTGEWVPVRLELVNPFRPEDPENSSGLGYVTYGYAQINNMALLKDFQDTGDLRVRLVFNGGYHVAVKADSVRIAFSH